VSPVFQNLRVGVSTQHTPQGPHRGETLPVSHVPLQVYAEGERPASHLLQTSHCEIRLTQKQILITRYLDNMLCGTEGCCCE